MNIGQFREATIDLSPNLLLLLPQKNYFIPITNLRFNENNLTMFKSATANRSLSLQQFFKLTENLPPVTNLFIQLDQSSPPQLMFGFRMLDHAIVPY